MPDYAHFSYSGLAFYKGILHVSTNFGLLEVKNGKINKVYQFQRKTRWFRGHGLSEAEKQNVIALGRLGW